MGFFVIGWDEDTVETYYRTLDFCDECSLIPFIFTLTPMPGSSIYQEYLAKGRVYQGRPWSEYGGGGESVVFEHPLMSESEMRAANSEVLWRGYSLGRVLKRTFHAITHGCSTEVAKNAFFMQLGLRKAYHRLYDRGRARPSALEESPVPCRLVREGRIGRALPALRSGRRSWENTARARPGDPETVLA